MVFTYTFDQLYSNDDTVLIMFTNLESIEQMGFKVNPDNYFTADYGTIDAKNHMEACEKLFNRYNLNFPDGYTGRSMCVSDIVNLWDNDKNPPEKTSWYCDSIGFKQLR